MYYTTFDSDDEIKFNSINDIYNIQNPENVKYLNLNENNLTHLDKDIFTNLTQLQYLNLSHNNNLTYLDKELFKYNTQLQYLDLDRNNLTHLDKDLFKYNTQLQKLFVNYNDITNLDENLFSNLTQLRYLNISCNNLTQLDKDLFKYNTLLLYLNISCNHLTQLDKDLFKYNIQLQTLYIYANDFTELDKNSFKYNTQLKTLNLSFNNLIHLDKELFKYNTQLQILNLSNNNLTQLPSSITRCTNLRRFNYYDNEINYIPPHIQRFLNTIEQQTNHLQVYNDSQNVHNHSIQESIKTSLENILNIPKTINKGSLIQDLLESEMNEKSIQLLLEYCQDNSVHSILNITFEETLFHILEFINLKLEKDKETILKILETEILDSECKCFTGRVSRLINCLNGFTSLVKVEIPENMEISNIIVMIKNNYKGNDENELKKLIKNELLERNYSNDKIEEFLAFVEL
jgi:Leucine-rich repeat (LRR) protein